MSSELSKNGLLMVIDQNDQKKKKKKTRKSQESVDEIYDNLCKILLNEMGKIIPKVIHTNSKKKKKVPKIRNRP
jgi:hypothetical protein